MKIKDKMILDVCMAIVLVLVMQYGFTGGLIHEVIGFVLIAGFLFHMIVNRKYYFAAVKILESQKNRWKNRITFLLNMLLAVSTVIMLISSICISKEVLGNVNSWVVDPAAWRFIHVTCAYVMVCVIAGHAALHYQMVLSRIKKITGLKFVSGAWDMSVRVVAAVLALLLLKTSIEHVIDSADLLGSYYAYKKTYVSEYVYGIQPAESVTVDNEMTAGSLSSQQIEEQTKESLNDYLSKLTCTGCSKHCSLLAPQCSKGVAQRTSAESTYNSMS